MNPGGPQVKTHASGEVSATNSFNKSSDIVPRLPAHVLSACERICVTFNLKRIIVSFKDNEITKNNKLMYLLFICTSLF